MATEVKVPSVGESISSGILAVWHVKDGDYVERDQILYELETDKVTSEGPAEVSGKISLKVAEGDEVEIGQVVAEIDESAEAPDKKEDKDSKEEKKDKKDEGSQEKESGDGKEGSEERAKESKEEDKQSDSEKEKPEPGEEPSSDEEEKRKSMPLSPAARRVAEEEGIDPSTVEGTGKGGRVTKADLLKKLEDDSTGAEASGDTGEAEREKPEPAEKASSDKRTSRKKMSGLRKKIADRLVQAQHQAAILTTFNEIDMSGVMQLRKKHQESFQDTHGLKLGFMSFFVKAAVHALKEVPGVNARLDGQEIVTHHFYDIGIAVSTDKGLVVPVVRDCDSKSFAEIEAGILEYAKKARDGKLSIDDLSGGVFTITNGGIYGSMLSTPILNPPQSGILGMHAIQERAVAVNGEVVVRPMMYLALSYDHRLVDGKEAVTFLVKVKEAIEDPTRLLLHI